MEATSFLSLGHPKLSYPSSSLSTENVGVSAPFSYRNALSFQSIRACTRACAHLAGNSSVKKSAPGKALQEDELTIQTSPESRTVNQDILNKDRLIALFRRIKNLISEGEPERRNETSFQLSTDDSSLETSVLEFLRQSSSDQVNSGRSEGLRPKGRTPKKKKSIPDLQHSSNKKPTRLPSNFVKKSPITSPTPLRRNEHRVVSEEGSSLEADRESEKFVQMKLGELKGLAKERGVKGYSKLKKSELIELLRSGCGIYYQPPQEPQ